MAFYSSKKLVLKLTSIAVITLIVGVGFQNCSSGQFESLNNNSKNNTDNSQGEPSGANENPPPNNTEIPIGNFKESVLAKQVYAGVGLGCIIDFNDKVKCWGGGSLGQAVKTSSLTPVEPLGVGPALSVVGGVSGVCALTKLRQVMCWSDSSSSTKPRLLNGLENVESIAAGWGHFCALTLNKKVICWGLNNFAQIGVSPGVASDGEFLGANLIQIQGLSEVKNLALGMYSSCVVQVDNRLFCWGSNEASVLGRDRQIMKYSVSPIEILGLGSVLSAQLGLYSACAIDIEQKVFCWGFNSGGQLGNGTTIDSSSPVEVVGARGAQELILSSAGACARRLDGSIQCWGPIVSSVVPVVPKFFENIKKLSLGYMFGCGLTNQQTVRCWGNNQNLQLGLSQSLTASANPVKLNSDLHLLAQSSFDQIQKNKIMVGKGGYFRCGLTIDQRVRCWGYNTSGYLGNNSSVSFSTAIPVDVAGLGPVKTLSVGGSHSCVITLSDTVKCWGSNYAGGLGNNTKVSSPFPVDVLGLGPVKAVQAGMDGFTCAITMNNLMKCWGYNANGVLGNNSTVDSLIPTDVVGLGSVKQMALGDYFVCAITTSDKVMCWGAPSILGKSVFSGSEIGYSKGHLPYEIESVGTVKSIAAGDRHVCALTSTNEIKCWGDSTNKRLGIDASLLTSIAPITVPGVQGAVALASRFGSTCVWLESEKMMCWGDNKFGKLGVGSFNNYIEPTVVISTEAKEVTDIVFDVDSTYFANAQTGKINGSGILVQERASLSADLIY